MWNHRLGLCLKHRILRVHSLLQKNLFYKPLRPHPEQMQNLHENSHLVFAIRHYFLLHKPQASVNWRALMKHNHLVEGQGSSPSTGLTVPVLVWGFSICFHPLLLHFSQLQKDAMLPPERVSEWNPCSVQSLFPFAQFLLEAASGWGSCMVVELGSQRENCFSWLPLSGGTTFQPPSEVTRKWFFCWCMFQNANLIKKPHHFKCLKNCFKDRHKNLF